MTTIELFNQLPEKEQSLLIIYFISGISFILFTFVTYFCRFIMNIARYLVSVLWFSIGFMFLSTGGKMLQGQNYNLADITKAAVIFCTAVAFWVVIEIVRWNKRSIKEMKNE